MNSSVHIDKSKSKYPINFTQPRKRFVLSLHYNKSISFLLVNTTKIYQFKAKDSEIKDHMLGLGNIKKILFLILWKKTKKTIKNKQNNNNNNKTKLKESFFFFPVDFNYIDTNDILDPHRYLMKGK